MRFEICHFEALREARGERISTSPLKAHGYEWYLQIYPRGTSNSDAELEHLSLFVKAKLRDYESVEAKFTLKCGNITSTMSKHTFSKDTGSQSRGYKDWISREHVLSTCLDQNGTLAIDVYMELYVTDRPTIWYPPTLPKTESFLSQLYSDEETTDVGFLVQDETYIVHQFVLRSRAPVLFDLAKDFRRDDTSMMLEIPNVNGTAFGNIVKYVYTVLDTDKAFQDMQTTMETLKAADRFGCIDLKLYIESVLVDKFLQVEHWSNLLLFADSHVLPLLKEAVLKLYFCNPEACQ